MAKKLIINADDFGYCSARNNGIIKCLKGNAVSSISVLVNGSFSHELKHVLCLRREPSIGLHFNITEGYSTSCYQRVSSLLDLHKMFRGKFGFRKSLQTDRVKLEDVNRYPCDVDCGTAASVLPIVATLLHIMGERQEQKLELTGRNPSHIDGHQHIQVLPGVSEIILNICVKEGISWMRVPAEVNVDSCTWIESNLKQFYIDTAKYAEEVKKNMSNKNIRCTNAFVGMTCMGKNMTIDRLRSLVLEAFQNCETNSQHATELTCELMVHPGYRSAIGQGGCGDGPDDFSLSPEREHEMDILCSKEWQRFLSDNGIQMCSFSDLS